MQATTISLFSIEFKVRSDSMKGNPIALKDPGKKGRNKLARESSIPSKDFTTKEISLREPHRERVESSGPVDIFIMGKLPITWPKDRDSSKSKKEI